MYVVTRPPTDGWHSDAISELTVTRRANVALVPDLHAKLYTAEVGTGSFALVGSANFTGQSANNKELGLLASSFMEGRRVVTALDREAFQIYHSPTRELVEKAQF